MFRLNAFVIAAALMAGFHEQAVSQTFETVYTTPDCGGAALGGLTKLPNGSFIGVANNGGIAGGGTIFQVTPAGVTTRLLSFMGDNGASPDGVPTAGADGKYYGITTNGGRGDRGVAYRISATGQFEKLADFSTLLKAGDEQLYPTGRLVQGDDGNFYGLCSVYSGGNAPSAENPQPCGLIFKLSPSNALSVVARFKTDGSTGQSPADGLVKFDGTSFLGVTRAGGSDNKGVVFKVTTDGTLTKVADFTGAANGSTPAAGMVKGSDGNFYGVTLAGGANDYGVVYKVTPAGDLSLLDSFDFQNGYYGECVMVEKSGTFYGLTGGGAGGGVLFKITPGDASPAIAKLADLGGTLGNEGLGSIAVGDDGNLYATTLGAGAANAGTVVQMTTAGQISKIAELGVPTGQGFIGGVVPGPGGALYGASIVGGVHNEGALFKVTTGGVVSKIGDFQFNGDDQTKVIGPGPSNGIMVGSDQKIYGVTGGFGSGPSTVGLRLFRSDAAGPIEEAASFGAVNIKNPGEMMEASDGFFYGTAFGDYQQDFGCIFRYSSANGIEKIFQFDAASGKGPSGRLLEGQDGALYGSTKFGGTSNKGTIFRLTKGGVFKSLASFTSAIGARPNGSLVVGRDGNFYGLAQGESSYGNGAVFRVSPDGKLSRVAAFTGFNGAYPGGGLVLGLGGNFYGTTYAGGGTGKVGTVFKVTPSGAITMLAAFDGQTNGANPMSTLCFGSDGALYGTAYSTVFRLVFPPNTPPVAKDDSFTLPVVQKNVIGNDTDAEKDVLTITGVTDGAHGTVDFTPDGTVTYLPGPDFDSGSVTSDSFTYTISDGRGGQSTATVTVNVPPDLLRAGAGVYGGVLSVGGSAQGYWGIVMTGGGAFTGAVYVDGVKTSIKGLFGPDGHFSKTVTRKDPLKPLVINLQLDALNSTISGAVTVDTTNYDVELLRNLPIYSSTRPSPNAGRYTVLLTPGAPGGANPAGTGYAKMTVTPKGAVVMVGKLGDNTSFAAGSFLTSEDQIPFYVPAYKNKGYVAGLLTFSEENDSDVAGTLTWKKPAKATDIFYPLGFGTSAVFRGARYVAGSPVLPLETQSPNANLALGSAATKPLAISSKNVVTVPAGDATKVKIDATGGVFTGTFLDGGTRRPFGGVIYQKDTAHGEGTVVLDTTTEKVSLDAVP